VAGTKNDVTRLIEFSLRYHLDVALAQFPMFSKKQIRDVYAMSETERRRLVAGRGAGDVIASAEHGVQTHRSPAQTQKTAEQATDPSNR
jgi:ABC-type phosphonate transport system ATPase subunit